LFQRADVFEEELNMAGRVDSVMTYTPGGIGPRTVFRIVAVLIVLLLLFWLSPFGTIPAGERGVHLRFSAVTGKVLGEGLYWVVPFVESVQLMDIKIQKEETKSDAASKDLQTVHSVVALNYHIDPAKVSEIYQQVGLQYKDRIIDPAMQEAIKGSTAKFTAEELITKREMVRDDIKTQLRTRLRDRDILVDEFNIVNFEFSKVFNDAIEAKVTAEQQALAAKNKLEQIKFEADQKVAEAHGKAEAITIESNALRSNPQILELRALEKWNGVLPEVTSGGVPFINLTKK
jgi:regulator of protease activity HflC (stomatin/prohibitin superfamily)